MAPLLAVSKVRFRYDQAPILEEVSLELEAGCFLGLVGPNGSGKTTLLRLAAGLLKPQAGVVLLRGEQVGRMPRSRLAREMALLPQTPRLPGSFTARELVMMGRTPFLGFLSREGPEDLEAVERAMEMADCQDMADRKLEELSGGEIQRVLMARALAQQPRLLLLDEPTAHMDMHHQIAVAELIVKLTRGGMAALGVFHDLNLAACYCHRVAVLFRGRVLALGAPEEVMTPAILREAFGNGFVVTTHPSLNVPVVLPAGSPVDRVGSFEADGVRY